MSFGNVASDLAVSSLASRRSCGAKTVTGYFAGDVRQNGELVQYQSSPGRWVTTEKIEVPSTQLGNPYTLPNTAAPSGNYPEIDGTGQKIAISYQQLTNGSSLVIYTRNNGIYIPAIVPLPTDAMGLCFNTSSCLSKNGDLCAFGSADDNSGVGAVWIYALVGGNWLQQGPKITGQGAIGNGNFGLSVAFSGSGNMLVIGAQADDGGVGAAYIYEKITLGNWAYVAKLVGTPLSPSSNFGWDVDFSEDGSTVAVGALFDGSGAAFVFTKVAGTWTQQVKLSTVGYTLQGYGVSLSGNGNVLAVSATADPLVYYRSGTEWSFAVVPPRPVDLVGGLGNFEYGWCDLSYNANTLVVSSYANNNGTGASWIYTQIGRQGDGPGTWTQNGPAIVGTGAPSNVRQGFPALSGDGKVVAITDNDNASFLWVFV